MYVRFNCIRLPGGTYDAYSVYNIKGTGIYLIHLLILTALIYRGKRRI